MHDTNKAESEGVQIKEIVVWVETISESMVWKVHKVYDSFWLSSEQLRSHFIFEETTG